MSKKMRMISMAPMMDCTDRHDRFFLRLISKNIFLYSEMIATGAILNGDRKKILEYSSNISNKKIMYNIYIYIYIYIKNT